MKTVPLFLALLLLSASVNAQAIGQPRCPVQTPLEILRLEMQHEKLLLSKEAHLQRGALDNIAVISKACEGKVTFERLVPTLVKLYQKSDAQNQVSVADALYAVNEATALNNLEQTIRGLRSRSHTEALWAHILESRQREMSLR